MPSYGVHSAIFQQRRAKRIAKQNSALTHRKDLLDDEELRSAVRMKNFQPRTSGENGVVRHDCCVLLCQHDAFRMRGGFQQAQQTADASKGQDIVTPTTASATDTLQSSAESLRNIAESTRFDTTIDVHHGALVHSAWVLQTYKTARQFELTTLWGLKESHWLRSKCLMLSNNTKFDIFILALILINCVLMALESPSTSRDLQKVIAICDEVSLYIFTLELVIKVIALGFVLGPNTYLRDPFNRLDMLVVCIGWVAIAVNQVGTCGLHGLFFCASVQGNSQVSFGILRLIRMLRPLRTIRHNVNLKRLVLTIVRAAPRLYDSAILFAFVLIFFGNIGVQLYKGAFMQRCVSTTSGTLSLDNQGRCMMESRVGDRWGACEEGLECREDVGDNLNDGVTSFDNLAAASLTIMQMITVEGWASLMYSLREVRGLQQDIFCLILVLFGSLFLINLVVAIIVATYFESLETQDNSDQPEHKTSSMSYGGFRRYDSREIAADEGLAAIEGRDCCKVRVCCLRICTAVWFEEVMMLLIIANTSLLALENIIEDSTLNIGNDIFTGVFVVEMIIKVVAFGPWLYIKPLRNMFDCFVAVVSVADSILTWSGANISLAALRTVRLLRVFKLARSLSGLQRIVQTLWASAAPICDLGLLMLLFIFVCALVGKSLFMCEESEKDDPDAKWGFVQTGYYEGKLERPNFSTFFNAVTATFILITGENWNELMYIGVSVNGWATGFFFVFVVAVGNYVLVNLFLAILIGNWVADMNRSEDRKRSSIVKSGGIMDAVRASLGTVWESISASTSLTREVTREDTWQASSSRTEETDKRYQSSHVSRDISHASHVSHEISKASIDHSTHSSKNLGRSPSGQLESIRHSTSASSVVRSMQSYSSDRSLKPNRKLSQKEMVLETGLEGTSLFCLSNDNAFRSALWKVVRHPYFDNLTYGLIALSAVVLALDAPEESYPDGESIFHAMDLVLTCLFSLEALIKIVVYGCFGVHGYFRDSWNLLDFLVVAISILNLATAGAEKNFAWFKALRALRALRPLRMVSRSQGMRTVVDAVITAIPDILEVFIVLSVFLLIFSILGVQLFKNKFNRCSCMEWCPEKRFNPNGTAVEGKSFLQLCSGECAAAPAHERLCTWERHPRFSFDNVFYALLVLFEIATLEMWPDVMWLAVDGVGDDEGPSYDHAPFVAIYFIVFIFVMAFFIMNLFVGVVIDKFTKCHKQIKGEEFLSADQLQWIKTQQSIVKMRPKMLINSECSRSRQLALQLIDLREFEHVIVAVIVVNIGTMCLNMTDLSTGTQRMLDNANIVFVALFIGESLLKIFAMQPKFYFKDWWNMLDFCIVVVSVIQVITDVMAVDTTVLRMFRIFRMFRLIKSLQALRELFETLLLSLPSLANVGSLLLLLFFVYAVAGMALFGDIQIESNPDLEFMSKDVNFGSFYIAMMLLFRMSTGENWHGIMHDCFSGQRCKSPPHAKECGSTPVAVIFFLSFMLIGSFVFLNLFVAVIVQNLSDKEAEAENEEDQCLDGESSDERNKLSKMIVKERDLHSFVEAWSNFAPNGSWYVPTSQLLSLLRSIPPPLGFQGDELNMKLQFRLLRTLGLLDYSNRIHFAETLVRLAAATSGQDVTGFADTEVLQRVNHAILRRLPVPSRKDSRAGVIVYPAVLVVAVLRIQKSWRSRKLRSHSWGTLSRTISRVLETSKSENTQSAPSSPPPVLVTPLTELSNGRSNQISDAKLGPLIQVVTCSQPLPATQLLSKPPHPADKGVICEEEPEVLTPMMSPVANETIAIEGGWLENAEGSPVTVDFPALEHLFDDLEYEEGVFRLPDHLSACESYCNSCGSQSHRGQVEIVMVERIPISQCIPRNTELCFSPRQQPVAPEGSIKSDSSELVV